MNYNDEQFQALAPFEGYFRTALRSGYAGYVGFRNAERIDKILKEAGLTAKAVRTNYACSSCVLRLLRKAGKAWFEDQEARIAAANDEQAIKASVEAIRAITEPASAPSKPKAAPTSTKTQKAGKTAAQSKTGKK